MSEWFVSNRGRMAHLVKTEPATGKPFDYAICGVFSNSWRTVAGTMPECEQCLKRKDHS